MSIHRLTPFQLEEVRGLLDICHDDPERAPWGRVVQWSRSGRWELEFWDPADAVDDLSRRAYYLISEGHAVGRGPAGLSGARSLRKLIAEIERAGA